MSKSYVAQTLEDFQSLENITSVSGLEYIRGMLDGKYAAPPITQAMNYRLIEVEEGKVIFRGRPTFNALNPMGAVHGGWYGTVLDSAMACAVSTLVPKEFTSTTLEFKINITRPIPMDMDVNIIGVSEHVGRSTGVASAKIIGVENGKLYATGSTTCFVFRIPQRFDGLSKKIPE